MDKNIGLAYRIISQKSFSKWILHESVNRRKFDSLWKLTWATFKFGRANKRSCFHPWNAMNIYQTHFCQPWKPVVLFNLFVCCHLNSHKLRCWKRVHFRDKTGLAFLLPSRSYFLTPRKVKLKRLNYEIALERSFMFPNFYEASLSVSLSCKGRIWRHDPRDHCHDIQSGVLKKTSLMLWFHPRTPLLIQ